MKCPPNSICIDKKGTYILFIVCVFIIYYLFKYFNNNNTYIAELNQNLMDKQDKINEQIENRLSKKDARIGELEKNEEYLKNQVENIEQPDPVTLKNLNFDRLTNPFLPPQRSPPHSSIYGIDFQGLGVPINIPTRGWSPEFQQIGVLSNDYEGDVLPLFGKPLHNGSNKWWYYTLSNQQNSIKLPIKHKNRDCQDDFGCQEIYDGDFVEIPILHKRFKVNLYKFDKPRYIPYIL
jgi:hypothetical protein